MKKNYKKPEVMILAFGCLSQILDTSSVYEENGDTITEGSGNYEW